MTQQQLNELVTGQDLLKTKLEISGEIDSLKNLVHSIKQDLQQAGLILPERVAMRPNEFAKVLGVSSRCVINWCQSGILKASQPGGLGTVWVIPVSELERAKKEGLGKIIAA